MQQETLKIELDENNKPMSGEYKYSENGLLFIARYEKGLIHGKLEVLNAKGQKYCTSFYNQGIQNGLEFFYYEDNNNQKKLEQNWIDGILEGKATWFYQNGGKEAEVSYIKNKRVGQELHWHEGGQIASESTFENGIQTGELLTWFANGDKESKSIWNNGFKQGVERYWHCGSDMVRIEINYLNGVQHGKKVVKDAAGVIISEENWVNGEIKQNG